MYPIVKRTKTSLGEKYLTDTLVGYCITVQYATSGCLVKS